MIFQPYRSYEQRHERTDKVKETIRKIHKCWHSENGGLSHAAGTPRNEDGSDSGNILGGAAEEPGFVTLLTVGIAVHVGCEDDGDELVASGDVEEKTCECSGADQCETIAGKADDNTGEALYHATGHHCGSEAHGTRG